MKSTMTAAALLATLAATACSQTGPANRGTGGTQSSGGSVTPPSLGGSVETGGNASGGGIANSGGAVGSGGVSVSGGANAGGAAGGASGSVASGGSAVGGTKASGGNVASGGAPGNGGGPATGGATGTGGTAAGGVTGTGGTTDVGGCPALPSPPTGGVTGTMITFVEDGGWCWYQDERAVVDTKAKKLVIGSLAFKSPRSGNAEATIYDMTTGTKNGPSKLGSIGLDDHNTAAFAVRPDGKYAAMWAAHGLECKSHYSVFDGTAWSADKYFDWTTQGCGSWKVTYSNLWYLGTDLVAFVRSVETSPNYLISKDDGTTWNYGGRLTSTPQVGYVAGYYKYWGNNKDRIDFIATQAHPRDVDTSLWHGYVKDGKIYDSAGTVVDDTLADKTAKNIDAYTQVFKTGTTLNGVKLEHAWNHDLVRYDDGTVAFLGQARVTGSGSTDPDKRMIYGRWDGTSWKLTYIVKLGPKLYDSEQDYTGMGALHPDNPHIIYVSSVYNPSDDTTKTAKHELYQGVTCDNGATWKWVPVTKDSPVDNLRPIVPKWDASHTVLLWMRGTYVSAQSMTMNIVGTISGL